MKYYININYTTHVAKLKHILTVNTNQDKTPLLIKVIQKRINFQIFYERIR